MPLIFRSEGGGGGEGVEACARERVLISSLSCPVARVGDPPPQLAQTHANGSLQLRGSHNGAQVVIFSQFTSFLDILQEALALREQALEGGGKVARLDGSMPRHKRNQAMSSFSSDCDVSLPGRAHVCLHALRALAARARALSTYSRHVHASYVLVPSFTACGRRRERARRK